MDKAASVPKFIGNLANGAWPGAQAANPHRIDVNGRAAEPLAPGVTRRLLEMPQQSDRDSCQSSIIAATQTTHECASDSCRAHM